jgi:hypothetical protein
MAATGENWAYEVVGIRKWPVKPATWAWPRHSHGGSDATSYAASAVFGTWSSHGRPGRF